MNSGSLDSLYLNEYMLSCPYVQHFGIECPGCGMQRSAVALSQGQIADSFQLYPALIPIIIMFLFLVVHLKWKLKKGALILVLLFALNTIIVVVNYILKFI